MNRRWILPILALICVGLAYGCADPEETLPQGGSGSATSSSSATGDPGSPSSSGEITATGTEAPSSPTLTMTPVPVPTGWVQYTDPVLRFSLAYPPSLVLEDLSAPSPAAGLGERVLDFRSTTDRSMAFSISVSSNTADLMVRDWATEFTACLPDTIEETSFNGSPALSCTEQASEIPNAGFLIARNGKIYHIGSVLTDSELESILASLRL